MLKEQDVPLGTKSSVNTGLAQMSSTGLINVAATRDGQLDQDGQANRVVTDPLTTTSTDTPSPTLISSTCSSASLPSSNESLLLSQTDESKAGSRNGGSVGIIEGDSVVMQQLTPALTQGNMTMDVAPDIHSSTFQPELGAWLGAEALAAIHSTAGVGGNRPGSGGEAAPVFPCIKSAATPSTLVLAASSALLGVANSESPLPSQAWEISQRLHTTEDNGAGKQECIEVTSGGELDNIAVGQHEEQMVVIHDNLLTRRNTDASPFDVPFGTRQGW
ncbi:hypothetical protein BDP27DRAFT_1324880 [Rhodocollybia butyracea]|uniref:Uncharacterized protein n=1 Tax=Rhodocollybia butyracea TaxID=206335 RepID=A0A9P5PV55_9AGAR|nr:hypothetical protein BDP27DRAFT_1324880 [Rhodocollybia butyracea]